MKEFSLIDKYFKPLAQNSASLNLESDVAVISEFSDKYDILISKDLISEKVHFFENQDPKSIAYRLLIPNLSDIAAAGGRPIYYMLGFTKNSKINSEWMKKFTDGIKEINELYGISLIGGDTINIKTNILTFSLTIIGTAKKGKFLTRNGAKNGDIIFVSGNIGDAYVGLQILKNKLSIQKQNYFIDKYQYPKAQTTLGISLNNLATASIDVSDGLFADLRQLCVSSRVSAVLFQNNIPISQSNGNFNIMKLASGGDDYELLFTSEPKNKETILKISKKLDIKVTEIGFISNNSPGSITLINQNGTHEDIQKFGYEHNN